MWLEAISAIAFAVALVTLVAAFKRATRGSRAKLTYRRGNDVVTIVVDEPDQEMIESMIAALQGREFRPRGTPRRARRA